VTSASRCETSCQRKEQRNNGCNSTKM